MAKLKLTVDKLDDVEEAQRGLYVEREGKFELDVDGVPELRSALKTANREAQNYRTKYKDIDPEEHRSMVTELAELREKAGPEALEAIKAQMNSAHGRELDKLRKKTDAMRGQLEASLIEGAATAEVLALKGAPALLLPVVKKRTRLVEGDDGVFAVQVIDDKGQPSVRGDGTPRTIKELVEELRADESYGRAFDGSGSAGSGMGGGGGGGRATKKRSEMSVTEKADFIAKNGEKAYFRLPY